MKRPSFKAIVRTGACFAALATLSFGFQNCAGKGFETVKLEEALEVVDPLALPKTSGVLFKRAYAAPATGAEPAETVDCGADNVESLIEARADGSIYLVRENCKNLDKALKLDIYKTSYLPHNPYMMIYNDDLFRVDAATLPLEEGESLPEELNNKIEVLCRAELVDNGTRRVTDVQTWIGADSKPMVKLLIADYRNGAVVNDYKSGDLQVARTFDENKKTLDQATVKAPDNFSLLLDTSAVAEVAEINYTKGIFGAKPPADYIDGETYILPGISCYR